MIDSVADFKKSSGATKGFYELKKSYYSHYNLFFYHYTREEQSKSEVRQRICFFYVGRGIHLIFVKGSLWKVTNQQVSIANLEKKGFYDSIAALLWSVFI